MNFSEAIFLGIVQGFAEWLPVSSEGLVSLASRLLYGRSFEEALVAAIWLHVGTLFSAILFLRRDVLTAVKGFAEKGRGRSLLIFLAVASAASASTALPILIYLSGLVIPDYLFTVLIGLFLIFTALIPRKNMGLNAGLDVKNALIVGLVQGFAIIPGVSRSGVTVTALLLLGFPVADALRISYLMSIPVVAGVQIVLPMFFGVNFVTGEMVAGATAAFLTGSLTMKTLITAASKLDPKKLMIPLGVFIVFLGVLMLA